MTSSFWEREGLQRRTSMVAKIRRLPSNKLWYFVIIHSFVKIPCCMWFALVITIKRDSKWNTTQFPKKKKKDQKSKKFDIYGNSYIDPPFLPTMKDTIPFQITELVGVTNVFLMAIFLLRHFSDSLILLDNNRQIGNNLVHITKWQIDTHNLKSQGIIP